MIADPEPAYKEPAADVTNYSVAPVQEIVISVSTVTTATNSEGVLNTSSRNTLSSVGEMSTRSLASVPSITAMSDGSGISAAASIPVEPGANSKGGKMELYEPHEANVTFSAGEGGYVAEGDGSAGAAAYKAYLSEHYPNSLEGSSIGATAFAKGGYHFLYWYDTLNKKVVSNSPTYVPTRPVEGWPVEWVIEAVFAQDLYDIWLDPNGGSGGGGGGSSGAVLIEGVALGGNYQLPRNGGDIIAFEKAGSVFNGWDVIAFPSLKGATGSYHLDDGQVLNSTIENELIKNGNLNIDWSSGRTPTVTLYAQWLAGLISIEYNASSNGSISYGDSTSASATETFEAKSGKHVGVSVYGPQGAIAQPNARYHFDSWQASGSELQMTEAEATAARLEAGTVKRLSLGDNGEYQPMTFTATFSPNTYVIKYGANGGFGSIGSQSVTYGESLAAAGAGFEREGYSLKGWAGSADGSGVQVGLGSTIGASTLDALINAGQLSDRNNAAATLYAVWEYLGGNDPQPEPEPEVDPQPSPEPAPEPSRPSNISDKASEAIDDYVDPGTWIIPDRSADISDVVGTVEDVAKDALKTIGKETPGLLASSKSGALTEGVLVARTDSASASAGGSGENSSFLDQLMSPEGMQQAGTTVAAVAAVGALMGLVGIGASVAGAAVIGAATIGAAGAVGLTAGVDLAADLAAVGAGAGAGAAAKRRREEEEDADDESEEEDEE